MIRTYLSSSKNRLSALLAIIAIHSFLVGIGLIIQIPSVMRFFGYVDCKEHFFPAQGGTFHVVMAAGYFLAAIDPKKYKDLVCFSIFVKAAATVFLFSYYFFYQQIWSVIASGICDGLMMILLIWAWKSFTQTELAEQTISVETKKTEKFDFIKPN
jgi:uncharacterized membrane protein